MSRYGGVPPYAETQDYVKKVMAYAEQYRGTAAAAPIPTGPASASPSIYGIT